MFDRGDINLLDPSDLSQEEYSALRHALNWRANSFQNAFQQYQLGLLDEDVWRQQLNEKMTYAGYNCELASNRTLSCELDLDR